MSTQGAPAVQPSVRFRLPNGHETSVRSGGIIYPNFTVEDAVRIIQRNERGRQARHRFRVIRDIRCVLSLSLSPQSIFFV